MRVLGIGCHPDDLEIACGGTMRKYADQGAEVHGEFVDMGLPVTSGVALDMTDVFTGEHIGQVTDFFNPHIEGHDCKLYLCKLVKKDV